MNFSIKIARLFGIEVRLHWTLLLFVAVLMILPWPETSDEVVWRLAYIGMVFASVLLHEFGHSFAGRFCDGSSNRILLWPLGGLAFVNLPDSPVAHFLTALAGPLVSLTLWAVGHFLEPMTSGWWQITF